MRRNRNLNNAMSTYSWKEIRSMIKMPTKKIPGLYTFTGEFYETIREEKNFNPINSSFCFRKRRRKYLSGFQLEKQNQCKINIKRLITRNQLRDFRGRPGSSRIHMAAVRQCRR